MRVIADITDPDLIQKILDHIAAQPPPIKRATTRPPVRQWIIGYSDIDHPLPQNCSADFFSQKNQSGYF